MGLRIDGVEVTTQNVINRAEGDPKLLAAIRRGYKAALHGDADLSPNYHETVWLDHRLSLRTRGTTEITVLTTPGSDGRRCLPSTRSSTGNQV